MRRGQRAKSSSEVAANLVKTDEVLSLKVSGLSDSEIAEALGMKPNTVNRTVRRSLEKYAKNNELKANEWKDILTLRLEIVVSELMFIIHNSKKNGEKIKASEAVTKVMDRISKLKGLDAPIKIELQADKLASEMIPKLELACSNMLVRMFPGMAEKENDRFNEAIRVFLEEFAKVSTDPAAGQVVETEILDEDGD